MIREAAAVVGLSLVAGAGYGAVVEGHTNEVARGKANTAEFCLETVPHESEVTDALEACFEQEDGVPGGNQIGDGKLSPGDPIEYVEAYIRAQEAEAESVEPGRVAAWSISPIVVAVGGIWYFS